MGQQAGGLAITESQELELAAPAVGRNGRARREAVEDQVARIISQLDPLAAREGLIETPRRVARMYVDELCSGYDVDIAGLFRTFDHGGYDGMVIVRDIPVTSLCEHHLVPFVGYAHVGYIPNGRVIGLSKIARVVEAFARRLQLQERLTTEIADALERYLHASGVIVLVEAEHLCMTIRGVQKPGTKTVTSVVRGDFADCEQDSKEEFLRLVSRK